LKNTTRLEKLSLRDPNVQEFITHNSSCIFSSIDWYNVLENGFNTRVLAYGFKNKEKLKLIIPGILLDFKIIKMFYSNIPYGGFIGDKRYINEFLPLLEDSLKKEGISILRICKQFSDNYDGPEKYKIQPGCQQIINIEGLSESEIWRNYNKRIRRDVRKAEKLGVAIKELSEKKELDILYDLYVQTMERNNTYPVWSKDAIYSIYAHLLEKDKAKVLFASLNGKYIAGVMLIYSEETMYYFISSSSAKYLSFCPNDLLMHNIILLGIKTGKKKIDLMTSRESDVQLIKFKEKWGAVCHPFYIFEKNLNYVRSSMWHFVWQIANTKLGGFLIRSLKK